MSTVRLAKPRFRPSDEGFMRRALQLARRGYGRTSPNPMVGAVLVRAGRVIGEGWHHGPGRPHAEIEAIRDAARRGGTPRGATLYVTLEPCCTHGRTPPCTDAIVAAQVKRVVAARRDPNPVHSGRGFRRLRAAGLDVTVGCLSKESGQLNEAFEHWIAHRQPWVTVKAAMTLDGKIATVAGESKWITGPKARGWGMRLRKGNDAVLVGIGTVLADDPALTVRDTKGRESVRQPWRIVLDSQARMPVTARLACDRWHARTIVVVGRGAPIRRVNRLKAHVQVWESPLRDGRIDLRWLLARLGKESVTGLLVEGGGEVNASFLMEGSAHRVAFFYAPKVVGGADAPKAVGGRGARTWREMVKLDGVVWRRVGPDLLLTARIRRA